jgi:hypothetical protein
MTVVIEIRVSGDIHAFRSLTLTFHVLYFYLIFYIHFIYFYLHAFICLLQLFYHTMADVYSTFE